MLSIVEWMKLCRLERFTRHLVISFQLLWSFALWKLLLLLEGEGSRKEMKCDPAKPALCVHRLSVRYWSLRVTFWKTTSYEGKNQQKKPPHLSFLMVVPCCTWLSTGEREASYQDFLTWANLPGWPRAACSPCPAPRAGDVQLELLIVIISITTAAVTYQH